MAGPSTSASTSSTSSSSQGGTFFAAAAPPALSITIHAAPPAVATPPLQATLPTPFGNWTYVYSPASGGTVNERFGTNNFVLEGFGSRNHLIGGTNHNILDPGAGENTMTNGGTRSTLYVHHTGATDDVTNFHPGTDLLTADAARHVVSSEAGTIVDQNTGTTQSGLILTFDDNSHMGLSGINTAFNPDWLVTA